MAKRWLYGTLIGMLLVSLTPALVRGQAYPDPVPIGPSNTGQVDPNCPPGDGPGPMSVDLGWPYMKYKYPQIPPMPIAHPNPYGGRNDSDCGIEDESDYRFIISGGYLPLWRHRMKDHALAVVDPVPFDDLQIAPPGAPVALSFSDVDTGWQHGFFISAGLFNQDHVYEIEGFYVPRHPESTSVARTGQLSSFFFNPPVGFEGTGAGLWDNADAMKLTFENQLINAELNSRWFGGWCGTEVEFLVGLRFMDQAEKLEFFTTDDREQIGTIPETDATYTSKTNNRLLGPQIGGGLTQQISEKWSFGINTKIAVMANYADIEIDLVRGDGLVGIDGGQQKWGISALNDTGAFVSLNGSRWRIKAGYRALWIYGLATAQDQVDFNLGNPRGFGSVSGSVLYHGPMAMIDFVF
jgi:hypothetical protein